LPSSFCAKRTPPGSEYNSSKGSAVPDNFHFIQGTHVFAAIVTSANTVSTLKQKIKYGSLALVLSFEIVLKLSHRGHLGRGEEDICPVVIICSVVVEINCIVEVDCVVEINCAVEINCVLLLVIISSEIVVVASAIRNTQAFELFVRTDSTPHDSLRIAIPLSNKI
jgi:hypothetical protein